MIFQSHRFLIALVRCLILLTMMAAPPLRAQPSSEFHDFYWVANGQINAMAETNGVLYIGGGFTEIAPVTGRFAPIEPATGRIAGPFPRIFGGTVNAAVPDGNGGWFIFYILQTLTNSSGQWISTQTNRPGMEQEFRRGFAPGGIELDRVFLWLEIP